MDPYRYIDSFVKFGTKGGYNPGLQRIKALLEPFNNPQDSLNIVHVAGSNGKGSTIAFLKSIYRKAGFKVGVYTSPHLMNFNERFEINNENITTEELGELVLQVQPVVKNMSDSEIGKPSYFELVTALGFLYFYQQEVDILLLEVGLGGRLDATNIVKNPLASVITGISLEHTSILGDTVEKIAREKAGIIKKNCPVVSGVRNQSALNVIKNIAEIRGSTLIDSVKLFNYNVKENSLEGQLFTLSLRELSPEESKVYIQGSGKSLKFKLLTWSDYRICLVGEHQVRNAIIAMTVVELLYSKYRVSEKELREGLLKAYIPGRMEIVQRNPLIVLDGAHNAEGIEILASFLKGLNKDIYIIFAVLNDKDVTKMLKELSDLKNLRLIISENNNQRAFTAEKVKKSADELSVTVEIIKPISKAFDVVRQEAGMEDVICITGSLYTVSEVKKLLL
ncbi:MAG: bifunctional folylpolyglutamate synthase/dihydrofolate synthase [Halanaerobiaceae bacterium]